MPGLGKINSKNFKYLLEVDKKKIRLENRMYSPGCKVVKLKEKKKKRQNSNYFPLGVSPQH